MRVTHQMLMTSSLRDLDLLRQKYKKAQDSVNGRVLERPSDDPQRVVEAMDLSGAKLRFERTQRTGQDSREWLTMAETHLDSIIDQLEAARDIAVQAGGPGALSEDGKRGLLEGIKTLKQSLMRELNGRYRDQYMFSGFKTNTQPFQFDTADDTKPLEYKGDKNEIQRDIAPNLSVPINIPGDRLGADGPEGFIALLDKMHQAITEGDAQTVTSVHLDKFTQALDKVNRLRSDLGVRYQTIEKYENYAETAILAIEERLSKISGADLEVAVIQMTEARTTYEAALVSFSKTLPTSLLDYMMR